MSTPSATQNRKRPSSPLEHEIPCKRLRQYGQAPDSHQQHVEPLSPESSQEPGKSGAVAPASAPCSRRGHDDRSVVDDREPELLGEDSDADSALASMENESTTSASDLSTVEDPVDNQEDHVDDREDRRPVFQHELCVFAQFAQKQQLALCPKPSYNNVLDLGTSGRWAVDFADKHPEAAVIGVDRSTNVPGWAPPNCEFQRDNIKKEWTWRKSFDLIHARMFSGSLGDPRNVIAQSFKHLAPGGYLELNDILFTPKSDDGTLLANSPLCVWADDLATVAREQGCPLIKDAAEYEEILTKAGFEDIKVVESKLPTNEWPADQTMKWIGFLTRIGIGGELETISRALTNGLGWDPIEFTVTCLYARVEFQKRAVHAYLPFITVLGKKPGP